MTDSKSKNGRKRTILPKADQRPILFFDLFSIFFFFLLLWQFGLAPLPVEMAQTRYWYPNCRYQKLGTHVYPCVLCMVVQHYFYIDVQCPMQYLQTYSTYYLEYVQCSPATTSTTSISASIHFNTTNDTASISIIWHHEIHIVDKASDTALLTMDLAEILRASFRRLSVHQPKIIS